MEEYKDLSTLSLEELLAENARAGREIDGIREYRRLINAEYDRQMLEKDIRTKHGEDLSDEAVEQISAIVSASRLSSKTVVKEVES